MGLLARNRRNLEIDLRDSPRRRFFSPVLYGIARALGERIPRHARGAVLDAGCGTMPFRTQLLRYASSYHSLDREARVPGVEYLSDIQNMPDVPSCAFDTVLCSEVLEHVPRPTAALAEIARVLRPGGILILTVPFLARLHEEPYDFFRYTRYGLYHLLQEAELEVLEIAPTGSVFCFLGHQVSSVIVTAAYGVTVVRDLVYWANAALVTVPSQWLDKLLGMGDRMPVGYVAVARRRAA